MNDLLDSAVAAHGGLDRWNQVKSITVDASITGALWALKSKADALKDIRFEVDTTRERLTMEFAGQDKRSVFEPRQSSCSAVTARSSTHVTTRRSRLTVISSRPRGTTSISPISPARRCGRT
jgi:hypothetical protein